MTSAMLSFYPSLWLTGSMWSVNPLLKINGICLFGQLNGIWGAENPPKITKAKKGMTMNFLQDVDTHIRPKTIFFILTGPICKLQTKIMKTPIFGNATARHANITKFCRIINIDIGN